MTSAASPPKRGVTVSVVPLVPAWRVDRTFDYALPVNLRASVGVGSLVRVPFGARRTRAIVTAVAEGDASGLEEVIALVAGAPVAPGVMTEVLTWLAQRYVCPLGRAFQRAVPARVRMRVAAPTALETGRAAQHLPSYDGGDALLDALHKRTPGAWCVRTLPGVDRGTLITELVEAALAHGGQALVAVPEVRFGSAVIDSLTERWPGLARLDSAQPDNERAHAWLRVGAGAPLGAGGRSTVLAPAGELRLIVIDEEHHPSYKEDRSPRYDARKVALQRAALGRAVCVFIGPTPSVETGAAALNGAFGSVVGSRAEARALRPVVETVAPPRDRVFSRELHQRIQGALRAGERSALLVSARGYARALWCAACARSVRCPVCERGLFYDRVLTSVRCSHCRWRAPAPTSCPSCDSGALRYLGAGSERLSEQLAKAFPRARVARMDPDLIGHLDQDGPPHDVDIYVTTWIGTKPAIRPPVSLVGVLDADSLLRRPDWRAAENAYQALAAMAEWAGPASDGGRLVVQTAEPNHYSVQAVIRGDYDFFLRHELAQRAELGYPPYSELIRATSYGMRRQGLIERAAGLARAAGARVLGPIEIDTVVGPGELEEGLEILIKATDAEPVARALRGILASTPAGSRLRIDVDPR